MTQYRVIKSNTLHRYLNPVNVSEENVFLVFDTAHDDKRIQTFSLNVPTPINCLYLQIATIARTKKRRHIGVTGVHSVKKQVLIPMSKFSQKRKYNNSSSMFLPKKMGL